MKKYSTLIASDASIFPGLTTATWGINTAGFGINTAAWGMTTTAWGIDTVAYIIRSYDVIKKKSALIRHSF